MLAQCRRRTGPDCGDARELAAAALDELASAALARHDHPAVAADVHLGRAYRLELDQRAEHDLEAELLQPLRERLGLLARSCNDDAQAARGGSHP